MKITMTDYNLGREALREDLYNLEFEEEVIFSILSTKAGVDLFKLINPTPELVGLLTLLVANSLLTGVKIGQLNTEGGIC